MFPRTNGIAKRVVLLIALFYSAGIVFYFSLDYRRRECLFFPSLDNPTCFPKIPAKFAHPRAADSDSENRFLGSFTSCPERSENPLILVKSSFESSSVRYLWRNYAKRIGHQIRFLVGKKHEEDDFVPDLVGENPEDIIFGTYNDTYKNLAKKTASAYEFVNTCFRHHPEQEILLIDQDTFYDPGIERVPDSINCGFSKLQNTLPVLKGKWLIDEKEWPKINMFPTYCSGACYSAPASTFMKIHEKEKSLRWPELTLEDLLFVGIYRIWLFIKFLPIKNHCNAEKRDLAGLEEPVLTKYMCQHLTGDIALLSKKFHAKIQLLESSQSR